MKKHLFLTIMTLGLMLSACDKTEQKTPEEIMQQAIHSEKPLNLKEISKLDEKQQIDIAQALVEKKQKEKALKVLLPLAEQGNSSAQFLSGGIYHSLKDYDKAEEFYLKGFKDKKIASFAGFQYVLGLFYLSYHDNDNPKKNPQKALYWLEKSANQGFVKSMPYLGAIYAEGRLGKVDNQKALYWFEKAVNHGSTDIDVYTAIGELYYQGKGIKHDKQKAKYWLEKAASNGDEYARDFILKNNIK